MNRLRFQHHCPRRRNGPALAGILLSICLFLPCLFVNAADEVVGVEQKVKAASLFRFLGYVEWPPAVFTQPAQPYVIGIVDSDNIADELTAISTGRTVNNRSVAIRRLKTGDAPEGLQVLFIGRGELGRIGQWIKPLQNRPVLTVTEGDSGLTQGGMINFRVVDDRVRFEVALDPIEKSGLKISSRMLSVALSIVKGTPP